VGAGLVALGAGHPLPELKGQTGPGGFDAADAGDAAPATTGGDVTPPARQDPGRPGRWADRATSVAVSQQPGQDLWQLPVRGNYLVSSMFGRRWGVLHPGVDLAVPEGSPIYAANAGTVILSRWNGGYGFNVMIQHDDGVVSVYGHASRLIQQEGGRVTAGDLIAYSGNTGYSTGPHLHFELRRDNKPFDAMPFMREHGVDLVKRIEVVNGGVLDPLG
jgi:murein DD-endopeptidase MepM/ murein hydrolase activator NlpD